MSDFVDVDAAVVGFLLVITIPALREGQCGGKGVTERSLMGLEGRAEFSPEEMTKGWSLEVRIMGCIENHSGGSQKARPRLVGAKQGVGLTWSTAGHDGNRGTRGENPDTRGLALTA